MQNTHYTVKKDAAYCEAAPHMYRKGKMKAKGKLIKRSFMPKQNEVVKVTMLSTEEMTGLVVMITRHGKGKTTVALEIKLRACGSLFTFIL